MGIKRIALIFIAMLLASAVHAQQSVQLENIGFSNLPGDGIEIRLDFNGTPPEPSGFALDNPARISLDLTGVASALSLQRYNVESANAQSVMVVDDGTRTRLIVNLNQLVGYDASVVGDTILLRIGGGVVQSAAATAASTNQGAQSSGQSITDISFRRGEGEEGQVIIELSNENVVGSIEQIGARVYVEFSSTSVPERLNRRFDVTDFATAVSSVDVLGQNDRATVIIDVDGAYEYVAYQSGNQYTISVQPPIERTDDSPTAAYTGEIGSLSFQDVAIHSVLQILADEYNFSLVAPSVEGNITLHLENVPWDQALELVLRVGNLDSRLVGNVLYVAPSADIAAQEKATLEATQQAQALAPLYTEYVQINYANANDILKLLIGTEENITNEVPLDGENASLLEAEGNGVLSRRGSATVDSRTNIVIVRDIEEKLEEVRTLVAKLDVPVKQVLIEARIVNVSTDFGKDLGVRWGGAGRTDSHDNFRYSGSIEGTSGQRNDAVAQEVAMQNAYLAGDNALIEALENNTDPGLIPLLVQSAINSVPIPVGRVLFPEALAVDLGVEALNASSFAIGFTGNDGLLELEISALESSGNGEVIARPKVTTQDKVTATIRSGVLIPYQAQAGGTAGGSTTEFQEAVLSLEVTPQITPDGRIIMQLEINQDSVAPNSGQIPAINTNSVVTSVLVDNGETIVLGGVFREEITTLVTKTPFFGDLPYLGTMFKRTENSSRRTELLIFITPKVIAELDIL